MIRFDSYSHSKFPFPFPDPIHSDDPERRLLDLSVQMTLKGKIHLETYGVEVVSYGRLENVTNIYDETAERAYTLARAVDVPEAEAIFLSGVGLSTMSVLELLEQDLGKPLLSSMAALTWASLRAANIKEPIAGYGRLLTM